MTQRPRTSRPRLLATTAALLAGLAAQAMPAAAAAPQSPATATPIKHLVILFHENVSFDHYFATYPKAANAPGEPTFEAAPGTPRVNNLATAGLLTENPNAGPANGAAATLPFRLARSQAATGDQDHAYTAEQQAYNNGRADLFPKFTGRPTKGAEGPAGSRGLVMGYYDGNTVTAMWRYAQHFAMSDNAYTDTYGPSTPGMLEVVSGQTAGMKLVATSRAPFSMKKYSYYIKDGQGGFTMINDVDPAYDVCSKASDQAQMQGRNIGDLLNDAGITWGSFMGGFDLTATNPDGSTGCKRATHSAVTAVTVKDYIAHHAWFQYFASTANPTHARPSSLAAIGHSMAADGKTRDPANHNYDLTDFYAAVRAGNFPAVSYIKAPAYQDGHAGYSDPLDEQAVTVQLLNFLQQQPAWKDTAVIVTWDDSDGWYDHAYTKPTHASFDPEADQLNGPGKCGEGTPPAGLDGKPVNGRCGPGTRIPFLVVSPWVKPNSVSHTQISQASVIRFIEDNWLHGARIGGGSFDATAGSMMDLFDFTAGGHAKPLYLDASTGAALSAPPAGE